MAGGACTTLCHVDFAYLAGLVGSCLFCFCFSVFMGGAGVVMKRSDNGVSGSWLFFLAVFGRRVVMVIWCLREFCVLTRNERCNGGARHRFIQSRSTCVQSDSDSPASLQHTVHSPLSYKV
jgi:hypothetical protein